MNANQLIRYTDLVTKFYLLSRERYNLANRTESLTDEEYKDCVNKMNELYSKINELRPQIDELIG